MRETFDGFQGGLQIWGRMITNLHYTDDIILSATSEAELHESVDRLDRVSRKYSLLINKGNGERRHSMPHTHSEWTNGAGGYVPVPWVPDYRRWWVYNRILYRLNRGQANGESLQKIWKSWTLRNKWRKTSWRLWDERTEKDSAGFMDSKENEWLRS